MLKKIRLTSGWSASLKTPLLKLPDSVRPHVNDRKWADILVQCKQSHLWTVLQFEPFRDFFLEPCSSHRPNVSFSNWNSVTRGIYGQVHPDKILVARQSAIIAHFLATTEIPSSLALCYYSVPQLHEHLNKISTLRARFLGKIQIRISESKNGFRVFWANPKTDHESIKSTLRVDSSDQIQIRIVEIHNLSVFLGKDLKKVFLTSGFSKKELYAIDAVHVWHSN